MTLARGSRGSRGLRPAATVLAALVLAGCANQPFVRRTADPAAPAPTPAIAADDRAASRAADRADYRLDVQAPEPLRRLLVEYLDLARFQEAPATDGVDAAELERLLRAAPAQARGLAETEGYFNARVEVDRVGVDPAGSPLLRVVVTPGPRAVVHAIRVDAIGDLPRAAAAGDAAAARELDAFKARWPLRPGDPFRQAAWADAKNASLARLRAEGYAAATWQGTNARVDAAENRVDLDLVVESGPLFRFGTLRIEGLSRYDEAAVRRLADFRPGEPYRERLLIDFQERLQKLGLFEGASVELDADASTAAAAPVVVKLKELSLQQATVGVGYSANTGPRLSVEHTHRRPFGSGWVIKNKAVLGPDEQSWRGDLISHPLEGLHRNLLSGSASRLRVDDQLLLSWNARIGRSQDTPRIERFYFAELAHARIDSAALTSQADAVSANYHWIYRDLDNLLLPTRGVTLSAQGALGHARGSRQATGAALDEANGPFARLYGRLTWYRPFGDAWFATARAEAGQVLAHSAVGIPDTLLFRAGGDDSVRGYAYRTLGPTVAGEITGGRSLLSASIEIARPIAPKYPAFWWAAFVDLGDAADRVQDLKPALGYGLGLRWRSPVGPLKVDVAYGQRVEQLRVHFSVGITF